MRGAGDGRPGLETDVTRPEVAEMMERVLREAEARGVDSLDELNAMMAAANAAYNHTPQEEFRGLSPYQMHRLLSFAWDGPGPAVVVRADLRPDDLAGSAAISEARGFLSLMAAQGGTEATTAGNLSRAFTGAMISVLAESGRLALPPDYLHRPPNEGDVAGLMRLRWLLTLAGLVRKTRGRFSVTRKGARCLADERAGELFSILFRALYRRLDLASFGWLPESGRHLQATAGYSLCMLSSLGSEWMELKSVARDLVLPAILDGMVSEDGLPVHVYSVRTVVVEPLAWMGLLEVERTATAPVLDGIRVRKTPLFDKALEFRLD